ncbi:hydratase [Paracoccus sp. JM45]|uniref:fumarylacetoacetate hydrolase family protein n=1 Tax=Paracoccus sp. JM45 TaxID=2283626 RepID=UPI000E6C8C8C|nr:hydratase [Paracoccus sp. JM45]RJE79888.1 hydratase [Paracoccus sp. JM45]
MTSDFDAAKAAAPLLDAWNGGPRPTALDPKPAQPADAYAVQEAVLAGLGDTGGLWKMALLDGETRQASVLPHRTLHDSGATVSLPDDAAVEVETALILAGEPAAGNPMAAIADICLAFELIASRLSPESGFTSLEGMADGFRSAGVVLGESIEGWQNGLPDRIDITLTLDNTGVVATEVAVPLMPSLDFLVWLAGHARTQGRSLKAGDVVITGARIGPLPFNGAKAAKATAMGAEVSVAL